jgi:hypothetical protein
MLCNIWVAVMTGCNETMVNAVNTSQKGKSHLLNGVTSLNQHLLNGRYTLKTHFHSQISSGNHDTISCRQDGLNNRVLMEIQLKLAAWNKHT